MKSDSTKEIECITSLRILKANKVITESEYNEMCKRLAEIFPFQALNVLR